MLIHDRGVAVCLSVVPDTVTCTCTRSLTRARTRVHTHARIHALIYARMHVRARISESKRRIGHGALQMRSTCVYHARRVTYSMGVTRTKKGQDGKGRPTVSGIKPREGDREKEKTGKPPSMDAILDRAVAAPGCSKQASASRSPLRPFLRIVLLHLLLLLLGRLARLSRVENILLYSQTTFLFLRVLSRALLVSGNSSDEQADLPAGIL